MGECVRVNTVDGDKADRLPAAADDQASQPSRRQVLYQDPATIPWYLVRVAVRAARRRSEGDDSEARRQRVSHRGPRRAASVRTLPGGTPLALLKGALTCRCIPMPGSQAVRPRST